MIATAEGTKTFYHMFDGNGNCTQLIDKTNGSVAAHYEYDAFGNQILSEGSETKNNTIQFSSKYHDVETGLIYYGKRYYSPGLSSWLNRDPLGEKGGYNLYAFLKNNPIIYIDPLGEKYIRIGGPPPTFQRVMYDAWCQIKGAWNQLVSKTCNECVIITYFAEHPDKLFSQGIISTNDGYYRGKYGRINIANQGRAMVKVVKGGFENVEEAARWFHKERDELFPKIRPDLSPFGQGLSEYIKPGGSEKSYEYILNKRGGDHLKVITMGRTNPVFDVLGRVSRVVGPGLMVTGVAIAVCDVVASPEGQKLEATTDLIGSWGAGFVFAIGWGKAGLVGGTAICGPICGAGASLAGTIAGGIVGSISGEKLVENQWE